MNECFICSGEAIGYGTVRGVKVPPNGTNMVYYCSSCRPIVIGLCYGVNLHKAPRQSRYAERVYREVWTPERAGQVFPPIEALFPGGKGGQ